MIANKHMRTHTHAHTLSEKVTTYATIQTLITYLNHQHASTVRLVRYLRKLCIVTNDITIIKQEGQDGPRSLT
jgi:hypothetical protein